MALPGLTQTVLLIASAVFAFIWHNNPGLSNYSLQLSSLLVMVVIFHSRLLRKTKFGKSLIKYQNITNSISSTILVSLLILATGGLSSSLFFALDFLLFGLSLLLHPAAGFGLGLALCLLFLLNSTLLDTHQFTNLISLLLMAPLARFFGSLYLQVLEGQNKIKVLQYQAEQLKSTIAEEEDKTLLWLSLNFNNKMNQALDLVSQIYSNLSYLPYHQREKLKTLYQDLKELFKSGKELEEKIDSLTD